MRTRRGLRAGVGIQDWTVAYIKLTVVTRKCVNSLHTLLDVFKMTGKYVTSIAE